MTRTTAWLLRRAIGENADLYHFHDPELIPVGLCLKMTGRRVVYDVHEDVPRQILSKTWIAPHLRRGISATAAGFENVGQWCFDGIVAATPSIARRFPADKTVVVQNYPMMKEFSLPADAPPYAERAAVIAYVGSMTTVRGIREIVQAIGLLPDESEARLSLAGKFEEAGLEPVCRALPGWSRVDHLGWQSRTGVAALLGRARAGLVLFRPAPNHMDAQPNKLFEYMAAGLPVIASDFPLWRRIVNGAGCGLLVDPLDPGAIARAIEWLLAHPTQAAAMGERGRAAVAADYNWDSEGKKLIDFYERFLA